jgi:beta-mannan synthase
LLVFWILFENVMSLHRTKATIIGLLDIGNVNEWIVTEKLGNLMKYRSAKYGKKYTLQRMASNLLARGWKMSERYDGDPQP